MKNTSLTLLCLWLAAVGSMAADRKDVPQRVKHQITGLFATEREQDLREAFARIPNIKLVGLDFATAEATLEYDPAKAFPGAKPADVLPRLENLLRTASGHTFGVKPRCVVPREKLKWIEIPVAGLDCKACSLAAYEAVYRLEGVETATASFREGRVRALIDPEKTTRARLEAALKQRGVTILPPGEAPNR